MSCAASAPPVPSKGATPARRQGSRTARAAAPARAARLPAKGRASLFIEDKNQQSRSEAHRAYSGTAASEAWGREEETCGPRRTGRSGNHREGTGEFIRPDWEYEGGVPAGGGSLPVGPRLRVTGPCAG